MRGGSRYSTAPPTKRGVDMSYPKAGLYYIRSSLEPAGAGKTPRTLFRRYAPAGTTGWERSVKPSRLQRIGGITKKKGNV